MKKSIFILAIMLVSLGIQAQTKTESCKLIETYVETNLPVKVDADVNYDKNTMIISVPIEEFTLSTKLNVEHLRLLFDNAYLMQSAGEMLLNGIEEQRQGFIDHGFTKIEFRITDGDSHYSTGPLTI